VRTSDVSDYGLRSAEVFGFANLNRIIGRRKFVDADQYYFVISSDASDRH